MTDFRILRRLLHLCRREGMCIGAAYTRVAEEMSLPRIAVVEAYLRPSNKRLNELLTTPKGLRGLQKLMATRGKAA